MGKRDEKIRIQLNAMSEKQRQEVEALALKVQTNINENEKARKIETERLLQKFMNVKHELDQQQRLEMSKIQKQLQTKNYAETIVGKLEGALRSV